MNYKGPRQRNDSKRWDYTNKNDGRVYPIGYCGEAANEPNNEGHHATEAEACECYKKYLLDTRLKLDGTWTNEKHLCEVRGCSEWTQHYADVDGHIFDLCDEHRTRAVIEQLYTVHTIVES